MYPLLTTRDIVLTDLGLDDCRLAKAYLIMNHDNNIINNFIVSVHTIIDT